ncbi:MAG: hypothetical protein QXN77_07335 [Candidatus Caldarchaeum sp.]
MDRIRLRFTGLTAYTATLIMTFTGLIFTVVITRRLTPEELGVWRYMGTLINYFVIPVGLLGFWATRLTAKGENILKTLLTTTATISAAATTLFLIMAETFSKPTGSPAIIFAVAALEIPSIYIYTSLESVAYAKKPHINYYAQLIQEFLKIPIAVVLVVILRLGLLGAVATTVVAFATRAATMFCLLKDLNWGQLSTKLVKRMASAAWLPLYQSGSGALLALDTVIIVLFVGSSEPVGYLAAAYLLGSLVSMSGTLAAGLYPKMLQQSSGRDVETSLSLVFMMAVPTGLGLLILGTPLLNILRPEYAAAANVLPLVIAHAYLSIVSSIMDSVIAGGERVDYGEKLSFKDLVKSRLFMLSSLSYIQSLAYIPSLTASLYLLNPATPTEVLATWVSVNVATFTPFVFYKLKIARQTIKFQTPIKNIASYILAAGLMGIAAFLTKPEKLGVEVLPAITQVLPSILISAAVYFTSLAAINREFRALVKAVVKTLL